MPIASPDLNLRNVLTPLADPLDDLITQLGLLGGEESWHVPWLADLGEALGLGFLPAPLSDDMSMLAGLALMADMPEMAFPTPVLPEGLAGLASPLGPEWERDPAEGRAMPTAQAPGFNAFEAAAGQAGLFPWPAWPVDGFGAGTETASTSPAGGHFDPFAMGFPAAELAGIGGWVPSPDDAFGFEGGPGPGAGAATLDSLFDGAPPDLGRISLAAGLTAPPARPGSFDALLAALSSATAGPEEAGAAPSAFMVAPAAPVVPWPDLKLAFSDNLMDAAQEGAPGPTAPGQAVSPRPPDTLWPGTLWPNAAPGATAASPAGTSLPPAPGMDGLPFASIADALGCILAQPSHEASASGHDRGGLGVMSAPAAFWSPPAGALPSVASAPGNDGLYAGGLTPDAMARLLPSLAGGSRGPDGGPVMPEAVSALTGLLAPALRPMTAPPQPRDPAGPANPQAPTGQRADAPAAGAAGQGRGSVPPDMFLDHRELERMVLRYVNRASTRPAGSRQHPNPKTLKRPGSGAASS